MSLYHETAAILSAKDAPGSLKTRVFSNTSLKYPPAQVYKLAVETTKWSEILAEVIDKSQLLQQEKQVNTLRISLSVLPSELGFDLLMHFVQLNPAIALCLLHDFLLSRRIALPDKHGLRRAIERHRARLNAEFTRIRIRHKAPSLDDLRAKIEDAVGGNKMHPRWIRVNTLKTTLEEQLATTFKGYVQVPKLEETFKQNTNILHVDEHIPNLVAIPSTLNVTRTEAYSSGAIILQDKASCFPAYLLDPNPEEGDFIDSCAAPGNKTTHLVSIIMEKSSVPKSKVLAFEKDKVRAKTLQKMVQLSGAQKLTQVSAGQDFLKVDPASPQYENVVALLLDPSCSGSGIVGRDDLPPLSLPSADGPKPEKRGKGKSRAGKETVELKTNAAEETTLVDDDGKITVAKSHQDLASRLEALSAFQLSLVLHAFRFPSARRITYSTCSVHREENEEVVCKALASDIARQRGWRILKRDVQVRGMRDWPARGMGIQGLGNEELMLDDAACVVEACIRAHRDDGRGTMGFFVAGFVRDEESAAADGHDDEEASEKRDVALQLGGKKAHKAAQSRESSTRPTDENTSADDGEAEWSGFDD